MKRHTHSHRLDILQTRIKAVESAARELSEDDESSCPFTFIERDYLQCLLYQLDEAQERMHSILMNQQSVLEDMWRTQEDVKLKRLFQDGDNHA